MGTKSKLLAMTEGLEPKVPEPRSAPNAPPTGSNDAGPASTTPAGRNFPPIGQGAVARTAPGQMLQFRSHVIAAEAEVADLREQLKQHDGALPTRKIDTAKIRPSRWANRHSDAFSTAAFSALKQDIEVAGGNVQPIAVRPLADEPDRYEIIYGHRRHRACCELGLPVLSMVDTGTVSDLELFKAMDRENRARTDLSAYEQGVMYRRALDERLYPSNRRLAEALGVSHTWVANVLTVADLPVPVLECFATPLEIDVRQAKEIAAALESDRKGVLRRAEKLRAQPRPSSAKAVTLALINAADASSVRSADTLQVNGQSVARWFVDRSGRLVVEIEAAQLVNDRQPRVLEAITAALSRP